MKLTIERAALLKTLSHVQSVVERRNTIPILSNVLLEAKDGRLAMTATDMDVAINEAVEADIATDGQTTAAAQTFYDIVRKLPDGAQVEIALDGEAGQLTVRAGRARFTLSTLPPEDFPAMNSGELSHNLSLAASELRGLIDRTRFAISTEETRYYLNGIYLHADENEGVQVLRAVAADGPRLARVEMPLPEGAGGMPGVIVPRKTVTELRKLIDEVGDAIEVGLSETRIKFAFDNAVMVSKLIDGTFPDYTRVIPDGNDKIMEVDRQAFTEAVDRVSTISTEKSRAVKLTLNPGNLVLSASSSESGSATEEIEVSYDDTPIEVGFNSRYLLDITQQIEGDGAQFVMADASSPTVVRDVADASALYVVMPMRV